jgi:hydrocephalus-inducing protein
VDSVVLPPGESYDLEITANLDDSVVIKEELHIMVDEGENLMIPLSAKGGGTTMLCKQDISMIDIGVQLTNCVFEKTIVLENKGRRHQQLKWINRSNVEENTARNSKKAGGGPKQAIPPVFTVTPSEIALRPRTATAFTFKGSCAVPNVLKEIFVLESKIGKGLLIKPVYVYAHAIDVCRNYVDLYL